MLTPLLHRVVARPWVYDLCQFAVGAPLVRRRLARRIAPHDSARVVIDIGGGTGAARDMWSAGTSYVCLDIDPVKLAGYAAKTGGGLAMLADATDLPIASGSVDAVVCTSVTHHLTDGPLDRMLAGAARVLKPAGRLFLLDAVWVRWLAPGRVLWRFDRGSHPRTNDRLRAAVAAHFDIETWDRFAMWHAYACCVARPRRVWR